MFEHYSKLTKLFNKLIFFMKTKIILGLIKSFSISLAFLITFSSCQKEAQLQDNVIGNNNIIRKVVTDASLISKFITFQNNALKSSNNSVNVEFDNSVVYEVSMAGETSKMLMANQIGFNESNNENYAFAVATKDGNIFNPIITKTSNLCNNLYQIDYYNNNFDLILSVQLNSEIETIDFVTLGGKGTGQNVANCIADAYTNHGWISVWAFVQTAFIPQTAVAIAAVCVAKNV